jgi:F-type H+-transporting ATPase subunit a
MNLNPMEQFAVQPILPLVWHGFDLSVTNQALWTGIAVAALSVVFLLGVGRMRLVPGRLQSVVEMSVDFARALTRDVAGHEALAFMPLIMTLLMFIAVLNLISLVPHSFAATSQISTTAYMALLVFLMVVGVGFYRQGLGFFKLFLPPGTPLYLAPLIVPLEVISFLARPFTLAVRLTANMVAGHVLLEIFAAFCVLLLGLKWLAATAVVPWLILLLLGGLEIFVAVLQAYIFTILTCVYLHDVLHGH